MTIDFSVTHSLLLVNSFCAASQASFVPVRHENVETVPACHIVPALEHAGFCRIVRETPDAGSIALVRWERIIRKFLVQHSASVFH